MTGSVLNLVAIAVHIIAVKVADLKLLTIVNVIQMI